MLLQWTANKIACYSKAMLLGTGVPYLYVSILIPLTFGDFLKHVYRLVLKMV